MEEISERVMKEIIVADSLRKVLRGKYESGRVTMCFQSAGFWNYFSLWRDLSL